MRKHPRTARAKRTTKLVAIEQRGGKPEFVAASLLRGERVEMGRVGREQQASVLFQLASTPWSRAEGADLASPSSVAGVDRRAASGPPCS